MRGAAENPRGINIYHTRLIFWRDKKLFLITAPLLILVGRICPHSGGLERVRHFSDPIFNRTHDYIIQVMLSSFLKIVSFILHVETPKYI